MPTVPGEDRQCDLCGQLVQPAGRCRAKPVECGIGVVDLSWWGPGSFSDRAVALVMDVMHAHDIQITFHLEPYGRARVDRFAEIAEDCDESAQLYEQTWIRGPELAPDVERQTARADELRQLKEADQEMERARRAAVAKASRKKK